MGPLESLALLSPLPSPSHLPCLPGHYPCDLLPLHPERHLAPCLGLRPGSVAGVDLVLAFPRCSAFGGVGPTGPSPSPASTHSGVRVATSWSCDRQASYRVPCGPFCPPVIMCGHVSLSPTPVWLIHVSPIHSCLPAAQCGCWHGPASSSR